KPAGREIRRQNILQRVGHQPGLALSVDSATIGARYGESKGVRPRRGGFHMRELLAISAALLALFPASALAGPTATFSDMSYRATGVSEPAPGNYRNPVLPGFHPDPSVVRVGDDY